MIKIFIIYLWFVIFIVGITSCFAAKNGEVLKLDELEHQPDNLNQVIDHFYHLKEQGELPVINKDYVIEKFSAHYILQTMRKEPHLTTEMLQDTKLCNEVYFIRFNYDLNTHKYFFCFEDEDTVVFNSLYKKKDQKWIKIK